MTSCQNDTIDPNTDKKEETEFIQAAKGALTELISEQLEIFGKRHLEEIRRIFLLNAEKAPSKRNENDKDKVENKKETSKPQAKGGKSIPQKVNNGSKPLVEGASDRTKEDKKRKSSETNPKRQTKDTGHENGSKREKASYQPAHNGHKDKKRKGPGEKDKQSTRKMVDSDATDKTSAKKKQHTKTITGSALPDEPVGKVQTSPTTAQTARATQDTPVDFSFF
jgi:hypothetical protein